MPERLGVAIGDARRELFGSDSSSKSAFMLTEGIRKKKVKKMRYISGKSQTIPSTMTGKGQVQRKALFRLSFCF